FIDLPDFPPPPPVIKRESFLSFTGSSPDRSVLNFPSGSRKERPSSIQTMPLPARSRPSSYLGHRATKSDRTRSSVIWDNTTTTPEPVAVAEDHGSDWPDATHQLDWRQFHIELLHDE